MKTYEEFINEAYAPVFKDVHIPFTKKYRKTFRGVERMYPGVNQFLSVANRWVLKAKRFQNRDLRKLLTRMKRRPDLSDMKRADIKKIYDFIDKYNIRTIGQVRDVFADYSDFTKRSFTDIDGNKSFSSDK